MFTHVSLKCDHFRQTVFLCEQCKKRMRKCIRSIQIRVNKNLILCGKECTRSCKPTLVMNAPKFHRIARKFASKIPTCSIKHNFFWMHSTSLRMKQGVNTYMKMRGITQKQRVTSWVLPDFFFDAAIYIEISKENDRGIASERLRQLES